MRFLIKYNIFYLLLIILAGCKTKELTNLQKANRSYREQKYQEARDFYLLAEDEQKQAAVLPKMNITEKEITITNPNTNQSSTKLNIKYDCYYQFDPNYTAKAILGIANTYKAQNNYDMALYYYSYYIQFCVRQGIDFKTVFKEIEKYINDNNRPNDKKLFNILHEKYNLK